MLTHFFSVKTCIIFSIIFVFNFSSFAQHVTVSNERENIFYLGIDNPISVTAENCPCSQLVLKSTSGTISGKNCRYTFTPQSIGRVQISVYRKIANRLKKLQALDFRVKRIPDPFFKIGPYGFNAKVDSKVIAAQEFVRAELSGEYGCGTAGIQFFSVNIVFADSCKSQTFQNFSGKISDEIRAAFKKIKKGDFITFSNINTIWPDKTKSQISSLLLEVEK